jgi:hypothetical protein
MDTAVVVRATLVDAGDAETACSDARLIELSRQEPERFAEVVDRYHTEIHAYVSPLGIRAG